MESRLPGLPHSEEDINLSESVDNSTGLKKALKIGAFNSDATKAQREHFIKELVQTYDLNNWQKIKKPRRLEIFEQIKISYRSILNPEVNLKQLRNLIQYRKGNQFTNLSFIG